MALGNIAFSFHNSLLCQYIGGWQQMMEHMTCTREKQNRAVYNYVPMMTIFISFW